MAGQPASSAGVLFQVPRLGRAVEVEDFSRRLVDRLGVKPLDMFLWPIAPKAWIVSEYPAHPRRPAR